MRQTLGRRSFLQSAAVLGIGAGLCSLSATRIFSAPLPKGAPNAEKIGWRLGCQAWSFRKFTLFDAIDKTASLGLQFIEAYPGQTISATISEPFLPNISTETRKKVLKKLADSGVKMVNFGVINPCTPEVIEFAKNMGIETVVSEPTIEQLDLVEPVCEKHGIKLAIHDHPKPSHYWNPTVVLEAVNGRSPLIGACCDTGHWIRSGLDPIECLAQLKGRIISFHLKDLDKKDMKATDVPWGKGVANMDKLLTFVHEMPFQGVFSIEYETNWDNNLPEISQCVAYFDKFTSQFDPS